MKSKSEQYVKAMGMALNELPAKYQENFEAMKDFAEIIKIAPQGSDDYTEAYAEWEDYDEQILRALKRDYPKSAAASATGGMVRWNWVKEGEEVRADWEHPDSYIDGRYYITLPKGGQLAKYEKVGEGEIEFPGQDKRIRELLKRAPDWVKKEPAKERKAYQAGETITDQKGQAEQVYLVVGDTPFAVSSRHKREYDGKTLTFLLYYDTAEGLWKSDGSPYYSHSPTEKEIKGRKRGATDVYPAEDAIPWLDWDGKPRTDPAALDALEAGLKKLPQTKTLHSEYGEYTDERKKLHNKIIKEEVEGNTCIRREAPIAILTGGLPGSGKSTYIRNNKDWMDNPAIFKIDADEIRAKLPEYKGWNASQTHSETQDIVKTLLNKVGKFGCSYDVIYDGTMNKSKKYKPLIETLKKEGYRIFIMFLKVDKATSMERAMGRFKSSGRYVPRFVIEEGVQNGLTAFNELKGMVDGYVLIDGKTQEVLEKGGADIPDDRDYSKLDDLPSQKPSKAKGQKKVYKKDYYTAMDKAHPGLSRASVKAMKQQEYESLMDKLEQGGKAMGLSAKEASAYAEAYVSVHLPKGKKAPASKPAGKEMPSSAVSPKEKPVYSWKTPIDTKKLTPILNHCQEYALKVDRDTAVKVKGTGQESLEVMAKKGEYLIFDDQGYLVFVMNAASFKRKCIENTTLEAHLKAKHQGKQNPNDRPLPKELEKYRGVFGDYDGDGVLNVDDPDPYTPGDGTTVEEVKLADELEKIIDFRKDYDTSRNEFVQILKKHAEGETDILSRTKTPYSIINKLRRKRLVGKKGLTDIIGTMVVFPDQQSLEDFKDKVNAGKLGQVLEFDDYYKTPQAGYRAYHWNVVYKGSPVEIQAKTERVKKIAKANHTLYKEGRDDAEKLGAMMLLAYSADKGDKAAAQKIDSILKDKEETMKYLIEKKVDVKEPVKAKKQITKTAQKTGDKKAQKRNSESARNSPVAVIEKEIRDIRKAQKKPMTLADKVLFKKEYDDLANKKENKSYVGYIRKHLKKAEEDGVKLSPSKIIKLGLMIQPLVQSKRGAFLDFLGPNKKRLAPTYENLLRWSEDPGRYDLIGVDTSLEKATVKARRPKEPSIFEMIGLK